MKPSVNFKKALQWMINYKDYFSPLNNPGDVDYNKPYIELQLLLWTLNRNIKYIPKDCIGYVLELTDFAENIILDPKYYEQLLIKPESLRINGAAMMMYLGYKQNKMIGDIMKKAYPTAINISPELVPFRKLDLEFCIRIIDHILERKPEEKKDLDILAEDTILYSNLDLINYQINEDYGITHALFYLSDFGERNIPDKYKKPICHAIQTIAMKNILLEDMDLLAELLINMANLKIFNQVYYISLNELVIHQEPDGSFPGPDRQGKENFNDNKLDKKTKRFNLFRVNYHTTLVCIMALMFDLKKDYHD